MDGWNTTFLLGRPIFRGYVSFREGSDKSMKWTNMSENLLYPLSISYEPTGFPGKNFFCPAQSRVGVGVFFFSPLESANG